VLDVAVYGAAEGVDSGVLLVLVEGEVLWLLVEPPFVSVETRMCASIDVLFVNYEMNLVYPDNPKFQ
jgi:hypothetical protein